MYSQSWHNENQTNQTEKDIIRILREALPTSVTDIITFRDHDQVNTVSEYVCLVRHILGKAPRFEKLMSVSKWSVPDILKTASWKNSPTEKKFDGYCIKCKEKGHIAKDCTFDFSQLPPDKWCSKCKVRGHNFGTCRSKDKTKADISVGRVEKDKVIEVNKEVLFKCIEKRSL